MDSSTQKRVRFHIRFPLYFLLDSTSIQADKTIEDFDETTTFYYVKTTIGEPKTPAVCMPLFADVAEASEFSKKFPHPIIASIPNRGELIRLMNFQSTVKNKPTHIALHSDNGTRSIVPIEELTNETNYFKWQGRPHPETE